MPRYRLADPMFDTRHRCPHCHVRTWMTDYRAFMADHDRPDGRRCRKAALSVSPLSEGEPMTNTERKSDNA
jgi:hypothetical protein